MKFTFLFVLVFLFSCSGPITGEKRVYICGDRTCENNKEVKFSHFAGFDKKYAIFEDENNNQFITKATVYNLFATKRESTKNKIPKFYKLSSNSKIHVRVYRYYLNHKIYNKRNEIIEIL